MTHKWHVALSRDNWVIIWWYIEVADHGEFYQRAEYEEEAPGEVYVDRLHVADLGHVVIAPRDYRQQCQNRRDS